MEQTQEKSLLLILPKQPGEMTGGQSGGDGVESKPLHRFCIIWDLEETGVEGDLKEEPSQGTNAQALESPREAEPLLRAAFGTGSHKQLSAEQRIPLQERADLLLAGLALLRESHDLHSDNGLQGGLVTGGSKMS